MRRSAGINRSNQLGINELLANDGLDQRERSIDAGFEDDLFVQGAAFDFGEEE